LKNNVYIKNIFRTSKNEELKKAVTEKIEKLLNIQLKKV